MAEFKFHGISVRTVQRSLPPVVKHHVISLPVKSCGLDPQCRIRRENGNPSALPHVNRFAVRKREHGGIVGHHIHLKLRIAAGIFHKKGCIPYRMGLRMACRAQYVYLPLLREILNRITYRFGQIVGLLIRVPDDFALEPPQCPAANGIKVYIYRELMPVPSLSFAVRKLKTSAGVVITASHNPKQYNGYKVYGPDGCQMTPDAAKQVLENIRKIPVFSGVKRSTFAIEMSNERIEYISEKVIEKYYESNESINFFQSLLLNKHIYNTIAHFSRSFKIKSMIF